MDIQEMARQEAILKQEQEMSLDLSVPNVGHNVENVSSADADLSAKPEGANLLHPGFNLTLL